MRPSERVSHEYEHHSGQTLHVKKIWSFVLQEVQHHDRWTDGLAGCWL